MQLNCTNMMRVMIHFRFRVAPLPSPEPLPARTVFLGNATRSAQAHCLFSAVAT